MKNLSRLNNRVTIAIQTNGLTRCFGDLYAVDNLDLCVEAGKFYGFLGAQWRR